MLHSIALSKFVHLEKLEQEVRHCSCGMQNGRHMLPTVSTTLTLCTNREYSSEGQFRVSLGVPLEVQ